MKGYTLLNKLCALKDGFFKMINGLQRQEVLTANLKGVNNMTRKVKITFCIHHWAMNKSINKLQINKNTPSRFYSKLPFPLYVFLTLIQELRGEGYNIKWCLSSSR